MSVPAFRTMTEQAYLSWDGPREGKWEYVDGFVYAQAGASRAHNRISSNIQRVFLNATGNGPCWTHVSDLKVRVLRDGRPRYYLPDIVVTCDPNSTGDIEDHPCLIVEILSASTRAIDKSFKAADYLSLPSLQGYLLVDSEAHGVEFHRRTGQDWQIEVIEDTVTLPCLNVALRVDEMYAGVAI
jgi:Uma2 family endonuclease